MKKVLALFLSALLFASAFGCAPKQTEGAASPSPSAAESVAPSDEAGMAADYCPAAENAHYVYQGEGSEYASYDVYVDYTSETRIQQRVNNGGTVLARVVEIADGKVTCVYSQEESYYRENALLKSDGRQEVLLMDPIKTGTTWTLIDGSVCTITGTDVSVETPSGAYSAVAVETIYSSGGKTVEYYAKGIGLVKTVSTGEGYEVSSSLSEIQKDVPFSQTVRFYYPEGNDGKIYYKDLELSFRTNDVTRTALETAYKQPFEGIPGTVLSDNTKINSLYLNDDGMVYIDLSRDFVTEMNAGAGYETQILQCVANTFGSYYGADKVILTIDNSLYESGHIKLNQGEYLTVDTEESTEIK